MSTTVCHICKKTFTPVYTHNVCTGCRPIASICCTSAEDGVRYGIPKASLDELQHALSYEQKRGARSTIIKALTRAIKRTTVKS